MCVCVISVILDITIIKISVILASIRLMLTLFIFNVSFT